MLIKKAKDAATKSHIENVALFLEIAKTEFRAGAVFQTPIVLYGSLGFALLLIQTSVLPHQLLVLVIDELVKSNLSTGLFWCTIFECLHPSKTIS